MSENEEFKVEKNDSGESEENQEQANEQGGKVIDEANYKIHAPREKGPTAIGKGGDSLFRRIRATREQLMELMEETQTVQDWVQRETCNNVALACLDNENLKEVYFKIKDGFGEYGRISLMGFKTPGGVEIPRLKVYDTNGDVLVVLTGPMAIDEINKRAKAYQNSQKGYEEIIFADDDEMQINEVIADYQGNPEE